MLSAPCRLGGGKERETFTGAPLHLHDMRDDVNGARMPRVDGEGSTRYLFSTIILAVLFKAKGIHRKDAGVAGRRASHAGSTWAIRSRSMRRWPRRKSSACATTSARMSRGQSMTMAPYRSRRERRACPRARHAPLAHDDAQVRPCLRTAASMTVTLATSVDREATCVGAHDERDAQTMAERALRDRRQVARSTSTVETPAMRHAGARARARTAAAIVLALSFAVSAA